MKTVILTGGSNGIGRAIAKRLRKHYRIINIDKEKNPLKNVDFYKCDISDSQQLLQTIHTIKTTTKKIVALINNAGVFMQQPLQEQSLEDWNKIMQLI